MVSILVFLELALGQSKELIRIQLDYMFQSLFSWNLPSDVRTKTGSSGFGRFNPCFLGTCPRTSREPRRRASQSLFQSLFSWNLPSDSSTDLETSQAAGVSILVFLELALGPNRREIASRAREPVSILVFLELALGPPRKLVVTSSEESFNPCFLGTCPRTWMEKSRRGASTCFNPCFLGTCPRT